MNKYIDAERLKEKINEVRQDWLGGSTGLEAGESGAELAAAECVLDSIDDIIDSLQQEHPEVDLEKEIEEHVYNMPHCEFSHYTEDLEDEDWARAEFHHFYKLGLNARNSQK